MVKSANSKEYVFSHQSWKTNDLYKPLPSPTIPWHYLEPQSNRFGTFLDRRSSRSISLTNDLVSKLLVMVKRRVINSSVHLVFFVLVTLRSRTVTRWKQEFWSDEFKPISIFHFSKVSTSFNHMNFTFFTIQWKWINSWMLSIQWYTLERYIPIQFI